MVKYQFFVFRYKKKKHRIKIDDSSTILDLKKEILKKTNIPFENQKILGIVDESLLKDENLISSFKLKKKHPIRVIKSFFGDTKKEETQNILRKLSKRVISLTQDYNISEKTKKDQIKYDELLTQMLLSLDKLECDDNERLERKKIISLIQKIQKDFEKVEKRE